MNDATQPSTTRRFLRRLGFSLGGLLLLIAFFYAEEDLRGWLAWKNCRHALEAKGEVLDWNTYIPPPVPDDQNFFKAPKMAEWFVRPKSGVYSNELTSKLQSLYKQHPYINSATIAELTVLPVTADATVSQNADIVLRYNPFGQAVFSEDSPAGNNVVVSNTDANVPPIFSADTNIMPLIRFQEVPITKAIDVLERQAGIEYVLDPQIGYGKPDQNGRIKPEPVLSIRWANITARQALIAILDNYGLQLIYDPRTSVARITTKDSSAPKTYVSPDVRERLMKLFADAIGPNTASVNQPMMILARPPGEIKPLRMVFHSDAPPGTNEMRDFFTELFPNKNAIDYALRMHVEPDGINTFRVTLDSASSAGYLALSDTLEPDFDLIREALKRPYARMDGDYSKPYDIPIPNFVTVRTVSQALAERAKCDLLLGQPEKALHEVTLMHDMMRRLTEFAPSGKPMTLVSAMINVAVAGLYTETVADGMRLHAWQEPQLAALQKQFAEINLNPFVLAAFREESASHARLNEVVAEGNLFSRQQVFGGSGWTWKDLKNPLFWLLNVAPRGWVYQNMVNVAILGQKPLEGFDPAHDTVLPHKFDEASSAVDKFVRHGGSPYKILAAIAIPNFSRAYQTTAYNQTMVNEAQIVCALERYLLAHGEYPGTLDALMPQFIDKLPHDLIGGEPLQYRRTYGGNFLLYSVGWNDTDDDGQMAPMKAGRMDLENGDWVWQYPPI